MKKYLKPCQSGQQNERLLSCFVRCAVGRGQGRGEKWGGEQAGERGENEEMRNRKKNIKFSIFFFLSTTHNFQLSSRHTHRVGGPLRALPVRVRVRVRCGVRLVGVTAGI